jgi:hypothetical protein
MANTLRIKRRASGSPGAPTSLANAELAYNEVDDVLYYGKGTGGAGGTATTIPAIAGSGAFLTLSSAQTVSGNKTFTGSVDLTGSAATAATATASDSSTKIATTAFVKAQNYLTGNQTITFSGDASGSGTTSVTLTLANAGTAGTYTKVTTDAKGRVTSGTTLSASDIPTLTASKISDFDTQVRTNRLDQLTAPTASVTLNSQKITNLADPTGAQDAATKAYVDASKQGLDVKDSCRAATTANITLSGTQTIDGVALSAGERVLVKNQTTGSENGIYTVVSGGSWTRASDADTSAKVTSGMFTFVEEGTTNADSGWVLTTDGAIVLGTTSLSFTQFSGAGQITAGAGLTKTGNTIDAVGTADRITVNADSIDIASTYVGQTSITTLGTIGTGTWNGSVIGASFGGTGVNNGSSTITLGGSLTFSGAFTTAFTVTGNTSVTLPTTGTLVNSAVTTLSSLSSVGTITTGTWNGTTISVASGGTGATTLTGLVKGNGTSAFTAAVDGTDYLSPNATIDGGTF